MAELSKILVQILVTVSPLQTLVQSPLEGYRSLLMRMYIQKSVIVEKTRIVEVGECHPRKLLEYFFYCQLFLRKTLSSTTVVEQTNVFLKLHFKFILCQMTLQKAAMTKVTNFYAGALMAIYSNYNKYWFLLLFVGTKQCVKKGGNLKTFILMR